MNKIKGTIIAYLSILRKRDKNLWVFGAWFGHEYLDNSKYLFIRALNEGVNAVWITKETEIYDKLKSINLPVEMYDSKEGINIMKKAGYAIWSTDFSDVNKYYLGGAKFVNLWHGIPLKKLEFDDTVTKTSSVFVRIIKDKILKGIPYRKFWTVATSPTYKKIMMSAFRLKENRVLDIGYPRNDYFFENFYQEECDFSFLKGNKMIAYMPTHRNEGRRKIDIENNLELDKINEYCKENGYMFVIKKHFYHKSEIVDTDKYSNIVDITPMKIDPQELLNRVDILISDYSGSYIDYLLLDRPIIFYNFDMDYYLSKDRKMYFNYDEVTPGPKIQNKENLTKEIEKYLLGLKDQYEEERERVRKIFFGKHKGSCGHELLEAIKKL